ncbi:hypothetical protein [Arthrobacter caoxuetaonis]|uniref:Uncharacterized protein n=1 Tax=Arthrobacter caoxuetaonis TaxID=2886935 RepID=A0A9X1MEN3_9MICC|nr:hypothetical protein [Arthrobacter caoxuetaonis]MCC3297562.1 hypothetical protein [Arthrobacter caoxuetaonis]USQ57910.1 hypothetical protein NF551_03385 [Arthrobacter caoxuetaonis]
MASLGRDGEAAYSSGSEDRHWEEVAERLAQQARGMNAVKRIAPVIAGLISLVGVTGLVLVMTSQPAAPSYARGVFLTGLAVASLWLLIPAVLAPVIYEITQDAVVEPSPRSRILGALAAAAVTAPALLHAALMLLRHVYSDAAPASPAMARFLELPSTALIVIMFAVPVLLVGALYRRLLRVGDLRSQRRDPWSIGE